MRSSLDGDAFPLLGGPQELNEVFEQARVLGGVLEPSEKIERFTPLCHRAVPPDFGTFAESSTYRASWVTPW